MHRSHSSFPTPVAFLALHSLAYCETSNQRVVQSGAFESIVSAFQAHADSKHVVQAGASVLLKLTYDSSFRSMMALEAGVPTSLRERLRRAQERSPSGSPKGRKAGGALWARLCEATLKVLETYEELQARSQHPEQAGPAKSSLLWW